ncbi:hypothetical protein QOZ80_1AG0025290 [Eleusine coracana subsp. coracana]|nr:hypothetical protein QOZ80_1AG0025290 [Eleusine coracana subsp. coracana]
MHTPLVDKSPHRRDSAGAGSWLKHRLAQILTRSSCATHANSDTAFVSLAKANADTHHHHHHEEAPPSPYFCTPCTYERPKVDGAGGRPRRRRSRSASLVHISVDCTGGAAVGASGRRSVHSDAPLLQQHCPSSLPVRDGAKKQQSRRRSSKPAAATRSPPSASRRHCSTTSDAWGRARRPRTAPTAPYPYAWSSSSSSTATDDELAPFSSDEGDGGAEEAETRTLFSSLSFSSESTSDFYQTNNNSMRTTRRVNAATRHAPRCALPRPPTLADAFRPLISVEAKKQHGGCNVDRKTKEEQGATTVKTKRVVGSEEAAGPGMAVVKRSSNPYADFRSSMVEMVVERRIASVNQMEELLGSYLQLNSQRHHPAILAAFEDVWETVFGEE